VQERDRILHKFPDLIDQHVEELAMLDTVDAGKLFLVGKVRDIPGARTCSATTPEEGAAAGCAGLRGGRRRRRRWPPWPAAAGRGGASGGGVEAGGGERVGPTDRGGGDVPSIERTERSFLSMEKKGRIIGNLL
jgi:hypothetical protein